MNRIWILVLAVVLLAARVYCAEETKAHEMIGGVIMNVESISAIVEAIDPATRSVTLKDEDDNRETVVCGPEIRNFDQIQKGDKVNVDYSERAEFEVSKEAVVPARLDTVETTRAPLR